MSDTNIDPDLIAARAAAAAPAFARTSPTARARALVAVADALIAAADELVPLAMAETGLAEARLRGELNRTAVQLRLFADTVVDGAYLDARLDEADPDFALGARPDVRRCLVPLGPVLNFAASNFPFAFSVAGGDTAAALAGGNPVILKAHEGHPRLSQRTGEIVSAALDGAGMPEHTFQVAFGRDEGVTLLRDARVRAGTFTGSVRSGRFLADIAAAREVPIPFFGELGSVNPVFVTQAALDERADAIADGFVASVSGSAGQLCTKPGFVFVPEGHGLGDAIQAGMAAIGEHRLLHPGIADGFDARRRAVAATAGVDTVVEGSLRFDDDANGWATPSVHEISLTDLLEAGADVLDESFGPLSVLVTYAPGDDLAAAAARLFTGNLTATVHAGAAELADSDDRNPLRALVDVLSRQAGRVLFDGWPTGVAVTPAMQHGGPYPATTNDSSTSVGTAAITRFLRPVAFQNAPQALLPEPLQDANPWQVPQHRAPAGESRSWGSRAGA